MISCRFFMFSLRSQFSCNNDQLSTTYFFKPAHIFDIFALQRIFDEQLVELLDLVARRKCPETFSTYYGNYVPEDQMEQDQTVFEFGFFSPSSSLPFGKDIYNFLLAPHFSSSSFPPTTVAIVFCYLSRQRSRLVCCFQIFLVEPVHIWHLKPERVFKF